MNFIVTSARGRGNGIVQYDEIAKVSRFMIVNPGEIMRLKINTLNSILMIIKMKIMLQTNLKNDDT
jgi:hypothetical protein